jgi:uncharacterized paraquat-inducible protein A
VLPLSQKLGQLTISATKKYFAGQVIFAIISFAQETDYTIAQVRIVAIAKVSVPHCCAHIYAHLHIHVKNARKKTIKKIHENVMPP